MLLFFHDVFSFSLLFVFNLADRIKKIAIFFVFCFNIASKGKSNFLSSVPQMDTREYRVARKLETIDGVDLWYQ